MPGLLRRFVTSLSKGLNALLEPAEDPRQTYADTHQKQRELLANVQQALASVGAAKGELEAKTAEVRAKLPGLEDQAWRALVANREDLARLALRRRQVAVVHLRTLEE